MLSLPNQEVIVSSEWQDSTTMQMKATRRQELETLRLALSGEQGRMLLLRDVLDLVIEAGLQALSQPEDSMLGEAAPAGGANGAVRGWGYA